MGICTQHRKQSRVECVCITGEEFAIHPKTKKHICTAIPTQSTPTIFAPDAPLYTAPQTKSCCVRMHHRQSIPYSPQIQKKTTFTLSTTREPHTQSMPHIFAPHAHTTTANKV